MFAHLPEEMLHEQPGAGVAAAVLLGYASRPADAATLAFAGVMGRIRGERAGMLQKPGLDATEARTLADRYFPGALAVFDCAAAPLPREVADTEYEDLLDLLLEHGGDDEETRWVALAVAAACLEQNHLWQDLGLPNRDVLSRLLCHYFPALAARNVNNMKWKKFFYKQLCERAEIQVCKAPSCGVCADYPKCFGPEVG